MVDQDEAVLHVASRQPEPQGGQVPTGGSDGAILSAATVDVAQAALGVADRASLLEIALAAGKGRLDPDAVDRARTVLDRTTERLRLGADHTVVALVGATGSGKSSLFNALSGIELSEVGARRPTTGNPIACVWGDGGEALLDWLEVPDTHRTGRESVLDAGRESRLRGLIPVSYTHLTLPTNREV